MSEEECKKIEKYIQTLIEEYRKEFSNEPKIQERRYIFPLELSEPCQITLLWLKKDNLFDYQIVLNTKNPKIKDKEIAIHGPYSIEDENDIKEIERLIYGDFFKFVEQKDKIEKYKKTCESFIKVGYKGIKKSQKGSGSARKLEGSDYLTLYYGRLDQIDFHEILDKVKQEISIESPKVQPYTYYDFFGGFIKPPVWFGKIPDISYDVKLKGSILGEYIGDRINFELKGKKGMLHRDGYIGISMKEWCKRDETSDNYPFSTEGHKDIERAITDLNEVFGFFVLLGYPFQSVESDNFGWKTYVLENDSLGISYRPNSYSEKMHNERFNDLNLDSFKNERKIISESLFETAISTINKYYELDNITDYKRLKLLEEFSKAFSTSTISSSTQSFKMLWGIIEQILKQIAKKRGLNIRGKKIWEIINKLHSKNIIDDPLFNKIDKMRERRNKITHELSKVEIKETQEILNLCKKLLITHLNELSI